MKRCFVISSAILTTSAKIAGGKSMQGISYYYNNARFRDAILAGSFYQQDPLAEKYYPFNPYNYSACNPLKFADQNGMEPVYNINGEFYGNTAEGFNGNVIIYTGEEMLNFEDLTTEELYLNYSSLVLPFDTMREYNEISPEAQSKIWTHIVSQFDGMQGYDEVFSMSTIYGGKIAYENRKDAAWVTQILSNGSFGIIGSGIYDYESTVENIASSVIVHEWYSHGMKHNASSLKSHRLAYKNVINFKKLWNNTTDSYKQFTLKQLLKHTKSETGRSQIDSKYRRLYKKFVGN